MLAPSLCPGAIGRRVTDATAPKLNSSAERSGNHEADAHAKEFLTTVERLIAPGLEAAVSDEYMASHWVATFAREALTQQDQ